MKSFSQKVIETVKRIPKGKVLTYRQVAQRAGNARAARAVGNIIGRYYIFCKTNKIPTIPCHRVIRSDGQIGGYVLGSKKKRELLIKEKAVAK